MAPVIFIFLMMAFSKTLEDEWTDLGLRKAQFVRKDNSPRSTRQLVSHRPGTFSSWVIFDLLCMIYLYDGIFVFESSNDIEKRINLLSNHFARLRLEMHIRTQKKPQRLNAYFPRPQVSLIHEQYRSHLSPPPPCLYRRKRVIKIDAHARAKNMPSAVKQKLSM